MMDTIEIVNISLCPDLQTPSLEFEKHQGQGKAYFIEIAGRQAILAYWFAILLISLVASSALIIGYLE